MLPHIMWNTPNIIEDTIPFEEQIHGSPEYSQWEDRNS